MIAALVRRLAVAAIRPALSPLASNSHLVRRLVFDAMPAGHVVTGDRERYVVDSRDKVIGRAVFVGGDFEFSKIERAFATLSGRGIRVRRFVDVGANIGTAIIPVLARRLADEGVAIEPHPDNARLLRANLALNGIDAVVHVCAVGASAGMVSMCESPSNSGDHRVGSGPLAVRVETLDALIPDAPDTLLWMDIQGYEGHALMGAQRLLAGRTPIVTEFTPIALREAGGYENFRHVLSWREVIDLATGQPAPPLDQLSAQLGTGHTDLLVI